MLVNREEKRIVDNWATIRPMTLKEIEWFDKVEKTEKETTKGKRILDPFKGWINK